MRTQPRFSGAMTIFARYADRAFNICPLHFVFQSLKWRVANGTAQAFCRVLNFEDFSETLGASGGQRCVGTRMKIKFRPDKLLVALIISAAMTTGGTAGC